MLLFTWVWKQHGVLLSHPCTNYTRTFTVAVNMSRAHIYVYICTRTCVHIHTYSLPQVWSSIYTTSFFPRHQTRLLITDRSSHSLLNIYTTKHVAMRFVIIDNSICVCLLRSNWTQAYRPILRIYIRAHTHEWRHWFVHLYICYIIWDDLTESGVQAAALSILCVHQPPPPPLLSLSKDCSV